MSKNAWITGSSGGIGRAIALRLAQDGWNVGIHYAHNAEKAARTAADAAAFGVRAEVYAADACDTRAMVAATERFIADFGGVDLLVNNVGLTILRPFLEVTEDLFDTLVRADLKAHYFVAQAAAKDMIARGVHGNIVNITSVQQATCFPEASVYGSVKAAFAKLTTHMAVELAPYGIRVNAVAPGTIGNEDGVMTPRFTYLQSRLPFERIGRPEEVANVVAFIVSGQADFINAANLAVDGGALAPSMMDNLYTPRVTTDKMG